MPTTTAWWWKAELGTPGRRGGRGEGVRRRIPPTPDPEEVEEFVEQHRRATLWPSPSAPATALTSSSPAPSPSCALTSWRRWRSGCPGSPSCCTAPLPCLRNSWRMINKYGGNMPGAIGVPEDHAAQGRVHGRVQDQHRLRPASGHDRFHSGALCAASRPTLTPASISSPPAPLSRPWWRTRSWTCWAAMARHSENTPLQNRSTSSKMAGCFFCARK